MYKFQLLVILTLGFTLYSQETKIYYFLSKDSLLGVKNEKGKIIVSARKQRFFEPCVYDGSKTKEIKGEIFFLFPKNGKPEAYNRKGEYLFEPNFFDFSIEDFEEGYIRIIENNKMGLADKSGKIIIKPKYDFISSVTFGIIKYCNGCYRDYKTDPEHPPLVGGNWGYLDKKGMEIELTKERNHPKDLKTKEGFIPYQFKYDKKECDILDFFEKRKGLIIQANNSLNPDLEIFFEIIEKPNKFEPFYSIRTYQVYNDNLRASYNYDDFQNFKVSSDLKKFYTTYTELLNHKKYSEFVEKQILVDDWLKKTKK